MSIAKLDFKIKDIELASYELSKYYIKRGYVTDVKKTGDSFTTLIYKKSCFFSTVGIKVTFSNELDCSTIEINPAMLKFNTENVINETLSTVTILPLLSKGFAYPKLVRETKKNALKVAVKYKEEK